MVFLICVSSHHYMVNISLTRLQYDSYNIFNMGKSSLNIILSDKAIIQYLIKEALDDYDSGNC